MQLSNTNGDGHVNQALVPDEEQRKRQVAVQVNELLSQYPVMEGVDAKTSRRLIQRHVRRPVEAGVAAATAIAVVESAQTFGLKHVVGVEARRGVVELGQMLVATHRKNELFLARAEAALDSALTAVSSPRMTAEDLQEFAADVTERLGKSTTTEADVVALSNALSTVVAAVVPQVGNSAYREQMATSDACVTQLETALFNEAAAQARVDGLQAELHAIRPEASAEYKRARVTQLQNTAGDVQCLLNAVPANVSSQTTSGTRVFGISLWSSCDTVTVNHDQQRALLRQQIDGAKDEANALLRDLDASEAERERRRATLRDQVAAAVPEAAKATAAVGPARAALVAAQEKLKSMRDALPTTSEETLRCLELFGQAVTTCVKPIVRAASRITARGETLTAKKDQYRGALFFSAVAELGLLAAAYYGDGLHVLGDDRLGAALLLGATIGAKREAAVGKLVGAGEVAAEF